MAIAFGAITTVSSTTGTSLTYSSPNVSGSDTFGDVCYHDGTGGSDLVTGVTWNSVAMTQIGTSVQVPTDRWIGAYGIVNPSSGSTNIVISASSSTALRSFAAFYTGVNQSTPIDSSNTGTVTTNAALSVATTVIASNCWTAFFTKDSSGGKTYSVNVGTMRINADAGGQAYSDSSGTVGTGSQTTTHTMSAGTSNIAGIAFSIAPSGATPSVNSNFLMFM